MYELKVSRTSILGLRSHVLSSLDGYRTSYRVGCDGPGESRQTNESLCQQNVMEVTGRQNGKSVKEILEVSVAELQREIVTQFS